MVYTKKPETRDISDYEVRIQSLMHEIELWRKRYQDIVLEHDRFLALEETVRALESRVAILQEERNSLN